MSTHPPASMPAEEHRQPAEASTEPLVASEEQSTSLSVALERDGHIVVDLTEPSRPFVIDLVRPEIAPPDVPSYRTESVERLGRVGMLAARRWQLATKRLIDIVGSLSILTVFSPLMLVIAIAIRLTSPGPVIYAQRRVGKGGRSFTMWKFRSMVDGAHEIRHRHAHDNRHTVGRSSRSRTTRGSPLSVV